MAHGGGLQGAEVFGLHEASAEYLQFLANSSQAPTASEWRQLADSVKPFEDLNALQQEVGKFLAPLASMDAASLSKLTIVLFESHHSKTSAAVLAAVLDNLHRHPAIAGLGVPCHYMVEMTPKEVPILERRVRKLSAPPGAADPGMLNAGGLLALDMAASVDGSSLARTLTAAKAHAAMAFNMKLTGFDPASRVQGLEQSQKNTLREAGMAYKAMEHRQNMDGPMVMSVGASHSKKLLEALSDAGSVIGLGTVDNFDLEATALLVQNPQLMPYRTSSAIEGGWLNLMELVQPAQQPQSVGAMLGTAAASNEVVQLASDLQSIPNDAPPGQRAELLSRLQAAVAADTLDPTARKEVLQNLLPILGQEESANAWAPELPQLRRVCDALLYTAPPSTPTERAGVAHWLAASLRGGPVSREWANTHAWATARLAKLITQDLGEKVEFVRDALLDAQLRQPQFVSPQSGAQWAGLVSSVQRTS